jgi:hypothetical protein
MVEVISDILPDPPAVVGLDPARLWIGGGKREVRSEFWDRTQWLSPALL